MIANAKLEEIHIVMTIGKDVLVFRNPKSNDVMAPNPICTAPIKAEALPAYFEKGAKAIADVFGAVKPTHAKIINKNKMKKGKVIHAFKMKSKKMKAASVCTTKAVIAICWLSKRRSKKLFTWLALIKPTDKKAKIHPKFFASRW